MNLIEERVNEFVLKLSSKAPIPGGGGASALAGALGIALGGMVANLTLGNKRYAEVEAQMQALKVSAYRVQQELMDLVQKDADAFAPLAGAYRMPTDTEEERESKSRVMEVALKDAALAPLEIMRKCGDALDLMVSFAEMGSKLALSDAACGAALCRAAMSSAWLNVCVNTRSLRDRDFAGRLNAEGQALIKKYEPLAEKVYRDIEAVLLAP